MHSESTHQRRHKGAGNVNAFSFYLTFIDFHFFFPNYLVFFNIAAITMKGKKIIQSKTSKPS
jgi:hypothetical protein